MSSLPCISRLKLVSGFSCLVSAFVILPQLPLHARPEQFIYQDELDYELVEYDRDIKRAQPSLTSTDTRGQAVGVTPAEPVKPSAFGGTFGFDFRSQYIVYGRVIQGQGLTGQTYINLRYAFINDTKPTAAINNLTGFVTTWSDFSSNKLLSSPSSPYPYYTESDLIFGVSATVAKRFNANLSLTSFISPAGAYGAGAFARAIFLYDDSKLIASNFSLRPQFVLVYSLPSAAYIGLNPSSFLYEPGFTPNYTFNPSSKAPLNFSLPVRLGLGNEFFDGTPYGYFSVGPQFTMRLPFMSTSYMNTNLNLGYTYTNLGSTMAEVAPNCNANQHIFNLGLSINY